MDILFVPLGTKYQVYKRGHEVVSTCIEETEDWLLMNVLGVMNRCDFNIFRSL